MTDISYFNVIFRWLQIVSNWLLNVTGYKKDKMIVNCPFNGMVKIKFYKKFFCGKFLREVSYVFNDPH